MPLIRPKNRSEVAKVAARLLKLADGDASRVATRTVGGNRAFLVDDELAALYEPDQADDSADFPTAEQPTEVTPPVVSGEPVVPVDEPITIPEPPDRNDSTKTWADYLTDPPFNLDTAGKKRHELIDAYDAYIASR